MEAGRYVHGVHDRGDRVCPQLRSGGEDSGQVRAATVFAGGWDPGEPGILLVLVYHESQLPLCLLRSDRRAGERVRVCDTDSGDGQVVSRQTRAGSWAGRRRLWRGVGDLRSPGAGEANSGVWTVGDISDSRLHFPGDDDGGGGAAAEPARGISARRVVTGSGQTGGGGTRLHARRNAAHAHLLPDVGRLCPGLLGGADGDQPIGSVRKKCGNCGGCPFYDDASGGRVWERLGTDTVGLDVGSAGAYQRTPGDDRDQHGRDASAVRRWEQRGIAVFGGVRRLLVLRNAALGERGGGGRL